MANVIKLKLLESIRIHLVVNISRVVKYKKLVKRQKVKEVKQIKVEGVQEWKFEKILNEGRFGEYKRSSS